MQNFKTNQVMVHKNGDWIKKHVQDTVPTMVKKGQNVLSKHYHKNSEISSKDINEYEGRKIKYISSLSDTDDIYFKKALYSIKSIIKK